MFDYVACSSWFITDEQLRILLPVETAEFFYLLDRYSVSFDEFCRCNAEGDEYEVSTPVDLYIGLERDEDDMVAMARTEIETAWKKLQRAFRRATRVDRSCLRLSTGWHDPDKGCPADDLSEGYFVVDGVQGLTKAGRAFRRIIDLGYFVESGD